jgi:MFS family permease
VIGVVFFVNTAVIVAAQLLVLRRIEGRSRARLLALVGVLWAGCWLLVGASALVPPAAAVVALMMGAAVFAVGETLWSPVQPALLNDLAPPHLRGRYNAVSSVVWNVGAAIGPLLVGVLLAAGLAVVWVALVVVGCLGAGAIALGLRHLLTPEQDGRVPAVALPAVGGSAP